MHEWNHACITIKDPELDRAVRELARRLDESLIGAIRLAVGNETNRAAATARPASDLEAELDALVQDARATRVDGAYAELEWGEFGEPR